MTNYAGGYTLLREPLVRGFGGNSHTSRDLTKLGTYAVRAVNAIQDTPWSVNSFVHDTLTKAADIGANLTIQKRDKTEIVLMLDRPMNPKLEGFHPAFRQLPPDEWMAMGKEDKAAFIARRSKLMKTHEEDMGTYRATMSTLATATEMSQFERFYFPHNMDFRTRIYPIPTDLTPQGTDLSKGLLRFARGTRLGERGVFWMGASLVAHWGDDKLAKEERYERAKDPEFLSKCQTWVEDPLGRDRGWLQADKPFQFLAVAFEWVNAHRIGDPEDFISYLPGNQDGSCNGAQHLSVMARDIIGAIATNCTDLEERQDLYLEVANRVLARTYLDSSKGDSGAKEWMPKLKEESDRRLIVKRAVMTVPYGVTSFGVAEFMRSDGHVDDTMENEWDSARYMRDRIMESIDETLSNGRALQRWFSECAEIVAEAGLPLCWDTPAGVKVTQAYRNMVSKRIRGFSTQFTVYNEPDEGEDREEFHTRLGMNVSKMATAAPPNVVHSCDASHLQITTCRMVEVGIEDFSMIHDSFGCPFAHVDLMRDIIRKSMVDMYSGDYLQTWKESVEAYSGLEMPEPPETGGFDITEILDSEYFFS